MSLRISRLFAVAMLIVSAVAMLSASFEAEARRMGGGGSFGRQSSNITQNRQAVTPPATSTTAPKSTAPTAAGATGAAAGTVAAKSGMSRWLGPIAGIAAGLGIAALLSHLGLSGAFLEMLSSLVLIGIVVFGVIYLVRRMRGMQPAATLSGQGAAGSAPPNSPLQRQSAAPAAAATAANFGGGSTPAAPVDSNWFIPGDFDTAAFLSQAKARFIEIQAIWDSGDVNKLREYLTDDLVAELKPQILARSGATRTEVVLLNAELLGIEAVSGGHLASVRYSGMLRESTDAEAFRFEEVWNLYKGGETGWLLAGIQQIPLEYAS